MTSFLPSTRRPDITVTPSGRIDIAARVVRLLNMQPGDVIGLTHIDSEYYLYIRLRAQQVVGRHECRVRPTTRRARGTFRTWSVRLARFIRSAAQASQLVLRFPCGEPHIVDNITYIPIIIRSIL